MKSAISLVLLMLMIGMDGHAQSRARAPADVGASSICSFYGRKYDGRVTASGKRFSNNSMTAAHRTFPMGTKLKLTNLANNKSVVVTVNDRGPFVKGRDISVTRRAAQELGFVKQGTARVSIEQLK